MSAFSNIPPQAVLPLGAYDLDELRKSARYADQRLLIADLSAAHDKGGVLAELGRAFGLPAHYGANLDALHDCMVDMTPDPDAEHPGFVLVLQHLPDDAGFDSEQREALLDVFRDAAGFYFDKEIAFRVFYSVRGRP